MKVNSNSLRNSHMHLASKCLTAMVQACEAHTDQGERGAGVCECHKISPRCLKIFLGVQ